MTLRKQTQLAALWAFLSVNYLYCDVLTLMEAPVLNGLLSGMAAGIAMTPGFLLVSAIVMEIPMAMILVSAFARYRVNRIANVAAGVAMTIIQLGSLFVGTAPAPHYVLATVVEVAGSLFVVAYALAWKRDYSASAKSTDSRS